MVGVLLKVGSSVWRRPYDLVWRDLVETIRDIGETLLPFVSLSFF